MSAPIAAPKRVPRTRLGSVTKPQVTKQRQPPAQQKKSAPPPPPQPPQEKCCDDPLPGEDDGSKVCQNCGTVLSESNIVAEVQFSEDSRGAATVQGGFVSSSARAANSMGGTGYRIGGAERNSIAEIENNGRKALARLCPRLSIPDNITNVAASIWGMAAKVGFMAGRRTDEVVAACLYAACRRTKDTGILLMDVAEAQRVNVFRLGEVYKALCAKLLLKRNTESGVLEEGGDGIGDQFPVEIEPLVMKYCRKLEFGDKTRQVAEDAVKIIRRMKRDWLSTGRHPAGLCGACIILAARMNNFRRSIREVVYVAKISSVTITKRVDEFRKTKSAALTVEQFRQFGARLNYQHDPPSFSEAELKKQKWEEKKRKRQKHNAEAIEINSNASTPAQSATPDPSLADEENDRRKKRQRTTKSSEASQAAQSESLSDFGQGSPEGTHTVNTCAAEAEGESSGSVDEGERNKRQRTAGPAVEADSEAESRYDADGFRIPNLPGTAPASPPSKRGRGRPKKNDVPERMQPTPEELLEEEALEQEMDAVMQDKTVIGYKDEVEEAKWRAWAEQLGLNQKQIDAEVVKARRDKTGFMWWMARPEGDDGESLQLGEFDNDPEVDNCLLGADEIKVKERIWLASNEDWLREQQEKQLQRDLAEARGETKEKKARRGKKKGRLGDGSSLIESETPIETPADANRAMLNKHAPQNFSKYINYEALNRVYGDGSPQTPLTGAAPSLQVSPVASPVGSTSASAAPGSVSPPPSRQVSVAPSGVQTSRTSTPVGDTSPAPISASPPPNRQASAVATTVDRSNRTRTPVIGETSLAPAVSASASPPLQQQWHKQPASEEQQVEEGRAAAQEESPRAAEDDDANDYVSDDVDEEQGYDDEEDFEAAVNLAGGMSFGDDDFGGYGDDEEYE